MESQRNHEIDVMKGLLILMVIWGHIVYDVGRSINMELTEIKVGIIYFYTQLFSDLFIAPYYMAAFFCITGYCSSFHRPLKSQVIIDFRRLVIPAILIPFIMKLFLPSPIQAESEALIRLIHGKMPWFLIALFTSKLMFKAMNKLMRSTFRWIILFLLSFLGCLCLNKLPEHNYLYFFHAMAFTLFIAFGNEMRKTGCKNSIVAPTMVAYGLILVLFRHLGYGIPALCAIITFRTLFWPFFILLSVLGTIICYNVAKAIGESATLEYLGRNSLVIYLTHVTFFFIASSFIGDYIKDHITDIGPSIFVVAIMFIGATLWGCLWTIIFDLKYFKWIIGK